MEDPYKTTTKITATANNPLGVLQSALEPLVVGPKKVTTVARATLESLYDGPIAPWTGFMEEINDLFHDSALQKAFESSANEALEMHDFMHESLPYWTSWNKVQVGAEITMSGEFIRNVTCPVARVLDALHEPKKGLAPRTPPRIPKAFVHGAHWISPDRPGQPDLVFMIHDPNEGESYLNKMVRIVGELKSASTVTFPIDIDTPEARTKMSLRRIIGQNVQDMVKYQVRFGLVSTYDETVFLKIDKKTPSGEWTVFYSHVVKHTDELGPLKRGMNLVTTSVRFGLFFLLQKVVAQGDLSSWSLAKSTINTEKWILSYDTYTSSVTEASKKTNTSRKQLEDKTMEELQNLVNRATLGPPPPIAPISAPVPFVRPLNTAGSTVPRQPAPRRSDRNRDAREGQHQQAHPQGIQGNARRAQQPADGGQSRADNANRRTIRGSDSLDWRSRN
ncbi:hypothetical protein BDV96DRAFT_649391 [Lophiotrema nucula]|uniref:Uncharacterized protein n=1 Tax=Lophiotrema nucula TaxID=690887 RepID=A0A6A5YYQ9_9PLEO|nr:hypothetical protein BDV96DRAFT_649391 [Lophiotrema nucula]